MDQLKYPIGRFSAPESFSAQRPTEAISDIAALPQKLKAAVERLGEEGLNIPYRPGGWTGRQVIHHLADSHMNALIRVKLALTEENPIIKPYREDLWADLADYSAPPNNSIQLVTSIHHSWHLLLTSLTDEQWTRTFYHPDIQASTTLSRNTLMYQWHGNHHLAHLQLIIDSTPSEKK